VRKYWGWKYKEFVHVHVMVQTTAENFLSPKMASGDQVPRNDNVLISCIFAELILKLFVGIQAPMRTDIIVGLSAV
jgi:hypothetical protein